MSATLMAKLACLFGLRAGNDKPQLLSLGPKTRVSRVLLLCVQRKLRKGSSGCVNTLTKDREILLSLTFRELPRRARERLIQPANHMPWPGEFLWLCKNKKGGREAAETPCPQNPNAMHEGLRTYVKGYKPLHPHKGKATPCVVTFQSLGC